MNNCVEGYAYRLRRAIIDSGRSITEASKEIGVSQQAMSKWLQGEYIPKKVYHDKLTRLLNIKLKRPCPGCGKV